MHESVGSCPCLGRMSWSGPLARATTYRQYFSCGAWKRTEIIPIDFCWRDGGCCMVTRSKPSRVRSVPYAKLVPPTLPIVLQRTRLFRLLDKSNARRLIWITAPAGAGRPLSLPVI